MEREMTMVERVAAEIAQASMTKRWEYLSGDVRQRYKEMARAAISAMREPTEGQLDAVRRKVRSIISTEIGK